MEADAKAAARAKAEGKDLRVVDHEGYQPTGYVEIGSYRGLDVGPDADARAEKAARREATEHRREFVASLLAVRISKGDVLALVLPNTVDDANTNEQAAMAKLLGLEGADDELAGRVGQQGDAVMGAGSPPASGPRQRPTPNMVRLLL